MTVAVLLLCLVSQVSLTIGDLKAACPYTGFEGRTLLFYGRPEVYSSDGSITVSVGGYSKVVSYGGLTGRGTIIETQCWNDLGDIAVWVDAF